MSDIRIVALLITLYIPGEKERIDADPSTPTYLYYW